MSLGVSGAPSLGYCRFLTHDVAPSGDNIRAILGLENRQTGVVDNPQENLTHIKRFSNIGIDD